ncbi:MAG: hypothetical protein PHD54_00715 [Desulfuromonadaceae bacterium]|nr:hypothetical protein [Desulfuromonadaceae bacterium]
MTDKSSAFSLDKAAEATLSPTQTKTEDPFSFMDDLKDAKLEGDQVDKTDGFSFDDEPSGSMSDIFNNEKDFSSADSMESGLGSGEHANGMFFLDEEVVSKADSTPENKTAQDGISDNISEVLMPNRPTLECTKFSCLKCSTANEVDFSEISGEAFVTKCSTCKASIRIIRESSAKRATQKSREKYCTECRHQLAHYAHCQSCGRIYPEYFVQENPGESKRKTRGSSISIIRDAFTSLGALRTRKHPTSPADIYSDGSGRKSGIYGKEKSSSFSKSRLVKWVAGFVILLIVAAASAYGYIRYKSEQLYASNYVKAVYGIKVGADGKFNTLTQISSEWKAASEAGRKFIPQTNVDKVAKAAKIKAETDKLMQQLQNPPGKYLNDSDRLKALYAKYLSLYEFSESSLVSNDQLNDYIEKSNKSFKQASQELKANLTQRLAEELEDAKKKYRGLATF